MKARDFLTLAYQLASLSGEAAWRSGQSRAYYAAFHTARELRNELGFTVPYADRAHGYLWLRLQNCGDKSLEAVGRKLKDLRTTRNAADYDLTKAEVDPIV